VKYLLEQRVEEDCYSYGNAVIAENNEHRYILKKLFRKKNKREKKKKKKEKRKKKRKSSDNLEALISDTVLTFMSPYEVLDLISLS